MIHIGNQPSAQQQEYREAVSPRGQTKFTIRVSPKELGRGAFAVVHEAALKEQSAEGDQEKYREGYVIKRPSEPNIICTRQIRTYQSLRTEKRMYQEIGEHPNIITCEATTPRGSLVMKRLNKTLPKRMDEILSIDDVTVRTDQIMGVNRDMLNALLHLKEKHITHNDAHYGNWLLDDAGTVKLIDFGAASIGSGEGLSDAQSYQKLFPKTDHTQHCFFVSHPFSMILENFIVSKTNETNKADKMLEKLYPIFIHDIHDYIMNKPGKPNGGLPQFMENFFKQNANIFSQKSEAYGLPHEGLLSDLLNYHKGTRLKEGDTLKILKDLLSDPELFPQPAPAENAERGITA